MPRADDGYFPRGRSPLRRVQGERAVGLVYGQRSLMLGALQPLAYAGTLLHTRHRESPFRRLVQTARVFEAVFFGSRDEADRALAAVGRMHDRVEGELPERVGPHPAGTAYSAYRPELMLEGVVAPMFDSARVLYEDFVRPLSSAERDELWRDYVRFGGLFGMPASAAPADYEEFAAFWREWVASDQRFLSEEARAAGYETGFAIPVPRANQPSMKVFEFMLLGSLPQRVRELYRLGWGPRRQAVYESLALASRQGRPLVPRFLRRGSCEYFFGVVARAERSRLARGEQTTMFTAH